MYVCDVCIISFFSSLLSVFETSSFDGVILTLGTLDSYIKQRKKIHTQIFTEMRKDEAKKKGKKLCKNP